MKFGDLYGLSIKDTHKNPSQFLQIVLIDTHAIKVPSYKPGWHLLVFVRDYDGGVPWRCLYYIYVPHKITNFPRYNV